MAHSEKRAAHIAAFFISRAGGTLPLTNEQRTELDRRLDAYESDKIEGREAGEVITEIKQRL